MTVFKVYSTREEKARKHVPPVTNSLYEFFGGKNSTIETITPGTDSRFSSRPWKSTYGGDYDTRAEMKT